MKGIEMQGNPEAAGHREEDPEDLAVVMHRIELLDYLNRDGDRILVCAASDQEGDRPPLIEVLGALRLAEDTFIRQYMGEATPSVEYQGDDDEDDDGQD